MHRFICAVVVGLGVAGGTTTAAQAAPQMLALVANPAPQTVQCHRGDCFAEFTAFCLQPERASPATGTVYRLHDRDRLIATATTHDGRQVALDPGRHLTVTAERSHVAVRIGLPAREMARLGLREVRIRVARNATLLPVTGVGDLSPLEAAEITTAAGPLRHLGDRLVDQARQWMPAVRRINRLINALPPDGWTDAGHLRDLRAKIFGKDAYPDAPAGADSRVQAAFGACQEAVSTGRLPSLRGCLQAKHDGFVGALNNRYWRAVKTGS
ncbi:MAG: hypothetical protein QF578_21200 [Alphaproteobacteria bacterium]|nr:hypothetical protein [Alphaproteobacteria bacterium]MDP6567360.1 hypothetical protein [Alphaproteobacteria bacterium]MDP6813060.1 hypothetical protein [Alphaproteobacteria bacterium]